MKLKGKIATLAFGAVLSTSVMAEGAPGSGPNPFSDCGIGAAIFKNDVAASISNVIWDIGTTAVTSATASPETCNGAEVEAAAFIMESYDNLIEETAKGQGDHIATLMNIFDVAEEERAQVISSVRAIVADEISKESFLNASTSEKAEIYYNSVVESINA